MSHGNRGGWEARAERAQRLREQTRAEKAKKAAGLLVGALFRSQPCWASKYSLSPMVPFGSLFADRSVLLSRLLSIDSDADVFLLASHQDHERRPLCRAHFRFDSCSNRRCKWSHSLSLGGAQNLSTAQNSESSSDPTDSALEAYWGVASIIHGNRGPRFRPPLPGALGPFLDRLPEMTISSILISNLAGPDAHSFLLCGRSLRLSGMNSPSLARLRAAALPRLQEERNR